MYTWWNSSTNTTTNDSSRLSITHPMPSSSSDALPSMLLIIILSVLCFLGVIFMIFGPLMRSEAWRRVDNYIFGQDQEDESREDDEQDTGE